MYNKIASIVMNSNKSSGAIAVYISQPDALTEEAAGKIFVLAEVNGKKNDGEKIINFLISELEENYYQDEKISLLGKIDGLKVENIFEAALAKTNKNLNDFLFANKINFNPAYTNITMGVVYQNNIHFSTFGRNRSLLVYRRQDGFEIINVETSAKNYPEKENASKSKTPAKNTSLFSSIVSGEIPLGSYFIFSSESLPEYLSGREMVEIITKLPPIVAAEQIKNVLAKINSYVPFLGIIIKNTTDSFGQEIKEAVDIPVSAQRSISSLNYTEQKTENMLAPAGIVSFSKTIKITRTFFRNLLRGRKKKPRLKKEEISLSLSSEIKLNKKDGSPSYLNANKVSVSADTTPLLNESLNESETPKQVSNVPDSSSFLRSPKINFKRGPKKVVNFLKGFISFLRVLFSANFWRNLFTRIISFFRNLNKLSTALLVIFVIGITILSFSLVKSNLNEKKQQALEDFNLLIKEIERKEILIDSHLLYDDEIGARRVLSDAQNLIASLPREKDYQIEAYDRLNNEIKSLENKVKKIVPVNSLNLVKDVQALGLDSLVFANNNLYGSKNNQVYEITLNESDLKAIEATGLEKVESVKFDGKNTIYYQQTKQIFRLNTKNNSVSSAELYNYNEEDNYQGFNLYNNNVYLLAAAKNQLYVYPADFKSRRDWLKEETDLSQSTDIYIDGRIYFLNNDGQVGKYFMGKKEEYSSIALDPVTNSASKILGDDKNLYILDNKNKRLVMLVKETGTLMAQYILPVDGEIKDFALDAEGRKLYFLVNGNIYEFAL